MTLQRLGAKPDSLSVSFEFFPPKSAAMEEQLWRAIRRLEPLAPSFVSVTYGAGGSTRDRTHATVKRIVEETRLVPAAHLTCVAATREEVDDATTRAAGHEGQAQSHGFARRRNSWSAFGVSSRSK